MLLNTKYLETNFPPEIQLLLSCAHAAHKTQDTQISQLLQLPLNWNYIFQQAISHNVFLLISQTLIQRHASQIPKDIQLQLNNYCQIKTAQNLYLAKHLCQLLKLFNRHQIEVIPFKGSALAALAYKSLALREFRDIDLLIDQKDSLKVDELLLQCGYQHRHEEQSCGQDFTTPDDRIHIDLQWRSAPPCFPYKFDFSQVWYRRETVSILNQKIVTLSPEDTVSNLCLQIAKDANLRRLRVKQICDLAQLISTSSLDWAAIKAESKLLGNERLLWFSLALVWQLLLVEIPLEMHKNIASDPIVKLYANHVKKELFAPGDRKSLFNIFQLGFAFGLSGLLLRVLILIDRSSPISVQNRLLVRQLLKHLFLPNIKDIKYISLPSYLHFLYYLIRPIRLISEVCKPSQTNSVIYDQKVA